MVDTKVYPSEINYRPGRIQSLTGEQEVALKQCSATFLKYWGYAVDLSADDIRNPDAFVVSLIVAKYPGGSVERPKELLKKKKSFFAKNNKKHVVHKLSSKRQHQLRENTHRHFVEEPLEHTAYVYHHFYKQSVGGLEMDDDTCVLEDKRDDSSVESFFTASSTIVGDSEVPDLSGKEAPEAEATESSFTVKPRRDVLGCLEKYEPETLHQAFFGGTRNDLINNFMLRFVRARKCKYEDVVKMMAGSMHWRVEESKVDEMVLEGDAPAEVEGRKPGFGKNFHAGKLFLLGEDLNGNPVLIARPKFHFSTESLKQENERWVLMMMEWTRLALREVNESIDTCLVLFDLSGFSLKNADNDSTAFLVSMLEANYPEVLGVVLIHNAPWIFSTIWNVIKHWLDPVVAAKIHFTKGYDDLVRFIDKAHIPKHLGGHSTHSLKYVAPDEQHTRPPKEKDHRYYELLKERDALFVSFLHLTQHWVACTDAEVSSRYLRAQIAVDYQLSANYLELDPYMRKPGALDRDGTLKLRN